MISYRVKSPLIQAIVVNSYVVLKKLPLEIINMQYISGLQMLCIVIVIVIVTVIVMDMMSIII